MSDRNRPTPIAETIADMPAWLRRAGVFGWLFAGSMALVVGLVWVVSYTANLTVPLAVAAVLGALFAPVVDWLARHRVPRVLGSTIVLVGLICVAVFVVWLVVAGVLAQGPTIVEQFSAGVQSLADWFMSLNLPQEAIDRVMAEGQKAVVSAGEALLSAVGSGLSGTIGFAFAVFLGGFMLFFILQDWATISGWMGRHLGVPADVGTGLVEDAVGAMRAYFESVTITGLIVAVLVGAAVWALDVPLALPIALVTWLTCYIPYVGAIISGAFAVMIALGAKGPAAAFIMLVVILLAQNVVQTIIQNKLASDRLDIHPLASLIATILGGILGGILMAMLAPALLAFILRARHRMRFAKQQLAAAASPSGAGDATPEAGGV